jgi:hypothetical protein
MGKDYQQLGTLASMKGRCRLQNPTEWLHLWKSLANNRQQCQAFLNTTPTNVCPSIKWSIDCNVREKADARPKDIIPKDTCHDQASIIQSIVHCIHERKTSSLHCCC